jgi:hypothetical protein
MKMTSSDPIGIEAHRKRQRAHAIRRYSMRVGCQIDEFDYRRLNERVFRFVSGQPAHGVVRARADQFWIEVGLRWLRVVWDERTQQISTFLPLSCFIVDRPTGVSSANGVHHD